MKATELMLGDIVGYLPTWINDEDGTIQREGDPNNPIPCKVEGLGLDSVILTNGEDSFDVSEIELYPIPLTAEILKKNGFEARWYEGLILDTDESCFALQKGVDGINAWWWEMFSSPIIPINYVHELQHALPPCGIEKEIII